MNWTEVRIFTTSEGIEPVTGALIALGINGMIVEDRLDLERFLKGDTAARWDYVDDEVLKQRGRETNLSAPQKPHMPIEINFGYAFCLESAGFSGEGEDELARPATGALEPQAP